MYFRPTFLALSFQVEVEENAWFVGSVLVSWYVQYVSI